ncbi:glutamate synthase, NADH/NADPH, small subunit domain protein [Mycolicibacterium hassiacum DSM 44199]|uniref:Glutamate synthase, NADH/NADPH, small subunit domain protein n=1 Tax=Mycolicibacterium hassiacum (strain DSM 44199 / CIP 105218 / JCM 12690 / 3849) TaxID=1122247 RepID=K5BJX5_MYCHD|nr:glutamate synthase subunit beta [Mycolicibacterium hassiacum]EKF23874.1 glutamate synthase, NADH/NADPH, small subunit domain protein [Mycolicibacterium hassiacum DSM 44199]MDA4085929.1 dihydropyrimidine dehydrogenase subunit A [Mycolicibacterium hassiacum DSM 44199]VCT90332.1 Glutamate synthase [NADPH] small chain [Mycolicibacterium hassiacum DSM 44199]
MADPTGFLRLPKIDAAKRPVEERVRDWREIYAPQNPADRAAEVMQQARRCMDCGIPFCHSGSAGCPLGNLIPEWNDLVQRGRWDAAADRLHATNNFPEFTGRVCPAPCEAACVLTLGEAHTGGSVTIKRIEQTIADFAWMSGDVAPQPPAATTGKRVAVVGSGPAGLAAAQQLTRAGHQVTVYERDDRIGGLLRYGIPEFKLDKATLNRRLAQMRSEGTRFVTDCEVGVDLPVERLRADHDAVVLAVGALRARDTDVEGRHLAGVHLAMEYLVAANRECEGDGPTPISAKDKHVVIIGGGDTGADCLGTAHRQGARSVTQLDYRPEPPGQRDDSISPWPTWPIVLRTRLSPAHDEGGERRHQVAVQRFVGDADGRVTALDIAEVTVRRDPDGRRVITPVGEPERIPCDLALLAIGFEGVQHMPLLDGLGLSLNRRGTLACGPDWQTNMPGVFVCGDAHRGASLVVWAIAEGRSAAHAVDEYLMGRSDLPSPVTPGQVPLAVV